MQQVGELAGDGVTRRIREQGPRLHERDARIVLDRGPVERVERLDPVRRPLLRGRAREHLAEDDRHPRVVLLEGGQDEPQVARDDLGGRAFLEIVGADEHHHRRRVEGKHVFLESQ
jgi:hypothetical protein